MGPVPRGLPTSPPGGDGGLVAHPGRRTPRATSTDPAPPGRVRLPAGPGGRSGQGSRARATLRCRRIRRTTPSPRLPRSPQRSVHQPVAPRSRIRRSSREWRGERTPESAGSDVRRLGRACLCRPVQGRLRPHDVGSRGGPLRPLDHSPVARGEREDGDGDLVRQPVDGPGPSRAARLHHAPGQEHTQESRQSHARGTGGAVVMSTETSGSRAQQTGARP